MKLIWLGHSAFRIEIAEAKLDVLIDKRDNVGCIHGIDRRVEFGHEWRVG